MLPFFINQVSSQTKQVNELHAPIKRIHKSLVKVNKKTKIIIFNDNFVW